MQHCHCQGNCLHLKQWWIFADNKWSLSHFFCRSTKDPNSIYESPYTTHTPSMTTKNNLLNNLPIKTDTQKNNLTMNSNTGTLGKCKKIYIWRRMDTKLCNFWELIVNVFPLFASHGPVPQLWSPQCQRLGEAETRTGETSQKISQNDACHRIEISTGCDNLLI